MSFPAKLEIEQATAEYNADQKIIMVKYSGYLNAETNTAVYKWLQEFFEIVEIDEVRGEIFDFRDVIEFAADNLMEARRKSRRMNLTRDVTNLPVAMIVKDFYQEEILRGPMQNVPENQRKKIVNRMADAYKFIQEWHKDDTNQQALDW